MNKKILGLFLKILIYEITICLIPTSVLSYFVINAFSYAKNNIFTFIFFVNIALNMNIIFSLLLKYFSSKSLRNIIKNKDQKTFNITAAINEIYFMPLSHSILAFLEWAVCPMIFVFLPFVILKQITSIDFLLSMIFTTLTAIVLMPLYYLLIKKEFLKVFEWLKDIKDFNNQKPKFNISISIEILFVLILSIIYPSGNLTFLIYLSNINYINLKLLSNGIIIILIGSLIISIIASILLSKIYKKSFIEINNKLKNISDGNLNQNIMVNSNNEFGDLSSLFNIVIKKLNNNVQSIKKSSEKLTNWIEKLSLNSSQLAKKSELQSNGVTTVTSTIEEYMATINNIKINVNNQANNIANMFTSMKELLDGMNNIISNAQNVSEKINENITNIQNSQMMLNKSISGTVKMNSSMLEISTKIKNVGVESENIDNILIVIEDISEKTNLLAINTAIEASHAGEFGKGFAIVAGEIKKLAENSKKSVKEISELIKKIKTVVNEAVNITLSGSQISNENKSLAEESGNAMEKVINNIDKIKILIENINNISNSQGLATNESLKFVESLKSFSDEIKVQMEEQTTAAGEIIKSITDVNQITDDNSKMSESLFSLTDDLKNESEALKNIINEFKN